ncbi:MAG: helix-turn-helix domain-containing protein [Elusimicrobia bacterium]|nr:helix-turn-helix domain-containing protein [Elusimicrobiota bacterium]
MKRTNEELSDAITGEKLFTVREAARVLHYHPFSIYRLVCAGRLRYRRLGDKTLLFSRQDLLRFRDRHEKHGPARTKPAPLGEAAGPSEKTWRQFRWEIVPLIRARLNREQGRRLKGLRISVRGREGEAWNVVYQAPKV